MITFLMDFHILSLKIWVCDKENNCIQKVAELKSNRMEWEK